MTAEPRSNEHPVEAEILQMDERAISARTMVVGAVLVLLVLVLLTGFGISRRITRGHTLASATDEMAVPRVSVAAPLFGAPLTDLVLPGNVTAWTDSPIYARTAGYLTHWYFDIGGRVKEGDLLAEISTPEVDQQLSQAEADLATAQASANNARIQADRYSGLVKYDAVSHQDTDTYVNQAASTAAAVKAADANVRRLREMQSYEKVHAPFAGVITGRYIDTGQLIDSGASKVLFQLQTIDRLRVYVSVPQSYSQSVHVGAKYALTFSNFPGRSFEGTLARTSDAIDPASRTLLVEIDLDNRTGELLPGGMAEAHFSTPPEAHSLMIPSLALIFRRGEIRVATVDHDGVAHLNRVTLGEDDGVEAQIISGLSASDQVIQDPPDSLIDGEKVDVVSSSTGTTGAGKK